jgi:hypothetical protein
MLFNRFLSYGESLYLIKRVIKESHINRDKLDLCKEVFDADTVLKKDDWLHFVEKIEEATIVEEPTIEELQPTFS